MRHIRRATKDDAEAIANLYRELNTLSPIMLQASSKNRDARDFYTAMGYDPDAKTGFIKYRRYFVGDHLFGSCKGLI